MSRTENGIKINSVADMFGGKKTTVVEVPLEDLFPFKNHPFKVLNDEKMDETVESIKKEGVLTPAIVRPRLDGGYEIISGHRRKRACEILGIETMPVIVKNYTDDEAVIKMVDSNIYREDIFPSEKAKAYRMKYDAEKHQGQDSDNTGKTLDLMADGCNDNAKKIQRYIWLSRLSDPLLMLVDEKRIPLYCGIDLSFLKEREQKWIEEILYADEESEIKINLEKTGKIKDLSVNGSLTKGLLTEILLEKKTKKKKISFCRENLSSYFGEDVTEKEIEKTIIMLLERWKQERGE